MSEKAKVEFVALSQIMPKAAAAKEGANAKGEAEVSCLVAFAGAAMAMGETSSKLLKPCAEQIARAARAARFKGKAGSALDIAGPQGLDFDRLVILGVDSGKEGAASDQDCVILGGKVMGLLRSGNVQILFEMPGTVAGGASEAADFVQGLLLRHYKFDLYKTRKKTDAEPDGVLHIKVGVADVEAAQEASHATKAVTDGVILARNLVNEPPNVLFPEEFAARAKELEALGVEVTVLDEKAMSKLGMGALLAVGQGSRRESQTVIMRWRGTGLGKEKGKKSKPIAFIGKGVIFDTGGISIKPGAGMEDMKGDMAGAACVVGLMHALAARKAKVDVIGAIGVVENMPDGNAYRPGDIVKSMSGQTIEIINTDAEGRLVLADVLWYVQDKYAPAFMVDLATLTGAILVALGQEKAGLFSNNDELSHRLGESGKMTGEGVWRLPMGPAYDKMIDSKFADMKNTGGRHGGSITAAQFLQRFVNDTPWAHLDIAGTGMGSPQSDINQSWGSGWGVRLLNRLVADYYEAKPKA